MKTWAFIQLARPFTPSAFSDIAPSFESASDIFKVFTDTVVLGTVSDVISDEAVGKLIWIMLDLLRWGVTETGQWAKP